MKITLKSGSSLILKTVGEGKGKELVIENFPSISKLLNTLDKRGKNEGFRTFARRVRHVAGGMPVG